MSAGSALLPAAPAHVAVRPPLLSEPLLVSSSSRSRALAFRSDAPTARAAIGSRLLAAVGLALALAGCGDRDPVAVATPVLVPAAPRLAVAVALAGPFAGVSATTELGTFPGGTYSEAMAINRAGMVAGMGELVGGQMRAFRWAPGATALLDLGALPGHAQSEAYGINTYGQVVGFSQRDRSSSSRAVLWHPSASGSATYTPIDLGVLPGAVPLPNGMAPFSYATAVNDYGQVVGGASSSTGTERAFLWTPTARNGATGTMQDLGTLPGCSTSRAAAINSGGQVVGWAWCGAPGGEFSRAFRWTPGAPNGTSGTMHDLGGGQATAINDAGLVAGLEGENAFVQRNGVRTVLGEGGAWAINGAGAVAGNFFASTATTNAEKYAGVWSTANGSVSALRIAQSSETWTAAGSAINDAGQVAGVNGAGHAVVWQLLANRAPTARPGGPYETADTIPVQLDARASTDPDGGELTYTWSFRDDYGVEFATGPTPLYYPREGPGVHTVTVTVRDAHGGSHTASTTVTVHATEAGSNIAASPLAPDGSYQGQVQLLFENVTAPGTTTITTSTTPPNSLPEGFVLGAGGSAPLYFDLKTTATFAGTTLVCAQYDPAAFASPADVSLLHGETVNGVLTWVDVTDRPTYPDATSNRVCGKVTSFSPFAVVARNAKPALGTVTYPTTPQAVTASVQVSAAFTDGNPGDVHAVAATTIEWGDGAVSRGGTGGTLVVREPQGATQGSVAGTHAYAAPGVYTVRVTVADRAGAAVTTAVEYVVVYDADAGFVTGGGWITSVAGAFKPNGALQGKASFGFVSRYEKGASKPTGNTQFQFHAANLVFRSTAYDWLVVSPTKAMYHGTGTVSGLGAGLDGTYQFQLTATDGQGAGGDGVDKFRIRIFGGPTGLLYDNEWTKGPNEDASTVLGGGSIQIKAR